MTDEKKYVNEQLDRQAKSASKQIKSVFSKLPNPDVIPFWILNITAFALVGGLAFAQVLYDPSKITEAGFWLPRILTGIALVLVFISTSNEYVIKYTKQSSEIKSIKENTVKKTEGNSLKRLPEYLVNLNLNNKKKAWIEKWTELEHGLDYKATDEDLRIYESGTVAEKRENKYSTEKNRIKRMTDPEYINANLPYLKVKTIQYTYSMIVAGVKLSNNKSAFEKNLNTEIAKQSVYQTVSRLTLIVILGMLIIEPQGITLQATVNLIGNIAALSMMFFNGVVFANDYVENDLKSQHLERMQILDDYYGWYTKTTPKIELRATESKQEVKTTN